MKMFLKLYLLVIASLLSFGASAQIYPFSNPTYIPQALVSTQTITANASSVIPSTVTNAYQINGVATLQVGVSGVNVNNLAATVQVTESRGTNPTWITIPVDSADGDRYSTITGTGLYKINVAGMAQARVTVASTSASSVGVTFSGGVGQQVDGTYNINKHTYHATVTGLVPAASATDFMTIQGSASNTVRVTHVECGGQASSSGSKLIQLQQRITSDVGGTSAVVASVPSDQSDAAATAIVTSFTANPTVGTPTSGVARAGILSLPVSTAIGILPLGWDFGAQTRTTAKEIILRGVNSVLAIHGAGANFPSGSTLNCSMEWVED